MTRRRKTRRPRVRRGRRRPRGGTDTGLNTPGGRQSMRSERGNIIKGRILLYNACVCGSKKEATLRSKTQLNRCHRKKKYTYYIFGILSIHGNLPDFLGSSSKYDLKKKMQQTNK